MPTRWRNIGQEYDTADRRVRCRRQPWALLLRVANRRPDVLFRATVVECPECVMAIRAPDFRQDLDWINTDGRRLSLADFRGRVTILDFWTYGCINCIHMIPEL